MANHTYVDMTGERYGRLTVLGLAGTTKDGAGRSKMWDCLCDCGNRVVVRRRNLCQGNTQSCGCYGMEVRSRSKLPPGVAGFRDVLRNYKSGARHRGLDWALSDEVATEIMQQPCFYCGKEPGHQLIDFTYNGIDRVDNDQGYYEDNVVPCCGQCNHMKHTMSQAEFRQLVSRIASHWLGIQENT